MPDKTVWLSTFLHTRVDNAERVIMEFKCWHYNDFIMSTIASQITSLTIVYSSVYSGADQRKDQSSASLAFVLGIHRGPVNSPHKGPVTRKMFPFDDIIMGMVSICALPRKPTTTGTATPNSNDINFLNHSVCSYCLSSIQHNTTTCLNYAHQRNTKSRAPLVTWIGFNPSMDMWLLPL